MGSGGVGGPGACAGSADTRPPLRQHPFLRRVGATPPRPPRVETRLFGCCGGGCAAREGALKQEPREHKFHVNLGCGAGGGCRPPPPAASAPSSAAAAAAARPRAPPGPPRKAKGKAISWPPRAARASRVWTRATDTTVVPPLLPPLLPSAQPVNPPNRRHGRDQEEDAGDEAGEGQRDGPRPSLRAAGPRCQLAGGEGEPRPGRRQRLLAALQKSPPHSAAPAECSRGFLYPSCLQRGVC